MGKSKSAKTGEGVPNRHVHSRISYLHQAASYLSSAQQTRQANTDSVTTSTRCAQKTKHEAGQARLLLTHSKGISRKTNIRLAPAMKRTICKRCQSLLVPGFSSVESVENASRHAAKPWADVFTILCDSCGTAKRFPIRQAHLEEKKKPEVVLALDDGKGHMKVGTVGKVSSQDI